MEEIRTPRRAPFGNSPTVGHAGRATQQRILVAASAAFDELGYAGTSVEAITRRAGCSRPTFYQYFSGKEDLHRRLAGRLGAELGALIGQIRPITGDRDGRDALQSWLDGVADISDRYQAVARNFRASLRADDAMVDGAARLSSQYRSALARSVVDPRFGADDLDALAGAVNVMAYATLTHRDAALEVERSRLTTGLADVLHRTFFGPVAGVNLSPRRRGASAARSKNRGGAPAEPAHRPRGEETRRRLLAGAYESFAVLGFDATRVDDIAAASGTSHGTFYRYFADKTAAFEAHLVGAHADLAVLVDRLPTSETRSWTDELYEFYAQQGGIMGAWREATVAGVPAAVEARAALAGSIAKALNTRSFGDTAADVAVMFSVIENVPLSVYGYGGQTIEAAAGATVTILEQGIFPSVDGERS